MAIAFPPVYMACAANDTDGGGGSGGEPRGAWRLSPDRVLDLRDVAMGVEEGRAGVCCRYLIDQLAGGGTTEVDDDGYVHHLDDLERFVERYGEWGKYGPEGTIVRDWRSRLARCRRALAKLRRGGDHRSVSVLMVAYGHPDPAARDLFLAFGPELATLARYVDAVEVKRLELAREEARRPSSAGSFGHWFACRNFEKKWEPLPPEERSRPAEEAPIRIDDYRARYERAERLVSSGEALRAALAPFAEAAPAKLEGEGVLAFEARKAARKARQEAHKERLDAFRLEVRSEARALLSDSERRYYQAWLDVPTERP